jgi:hypothetical protein
MMIRMAGNNDVAGAFCRLPREIRNRSTCRGCANMRASNCGVALCLRIWPNKAKKRGSRERSSPPCQIRTLTLPRCPEARGNIFNPDLTLTRKFFELSGHAARPSRITSAHHQTVFEPPFMTASAPRLTFMIVNSGTRWLPEPEAFGSKPGRGCRPKAQTGHQPQSFGGLPIVCEPFRRVELSSIRFCFSVRECCVTDTITVGAFHHRGGPFGGRVDRAGSGTRTTLTPERSQTVPGVTEGPTASADQS